MLCSLFSKLLRCFVHGSHSSTPSIDCLQAIEMKPTSKELLQLEETDSHSSREASLLIGNKKKSVSKNTQPLPDKKPEIGQIPKSQVLGKVQDFLGIFAEANKKLELEAKENPAGFDLEVLDGNESEVIEMDLMLGVADLHTAEAVAAAEAALSGYQPAVPLSGCDSETDSEDSSSDEDDDDDSIDDDGDDVEPENGGHKKTDLPSQPERSNSGKDDSSETMKKGSKKRPRIVELS